MRAHKLVTGALIRRSREVLEAVLELADRVDSGELCPDRLRIEKAFYKLFAIEPTTAIQIELTEELVRELLHALVLKPRLDVLSVGLLAVAGTRFGLVGGDEEAEQRRFGDFFALGREGAHAWGMRVQHARRARRG